MTPVRPALRALAAPLAAAALLGAPAVPALAAPAPATSGTSARPGHGSPWTPYRTEEVVVPAARSTCGFDVRITPLIDEEEYRTTSTWPDGTPRTQLFRGALVERYTNLTSGASVVRDLSATAVFAYRRDGSPASLTSLHGAFGTTMPPGSTPDTGLYVLGGTGTTVFFRTDDTRAFVLGPHGTAEDVCDALD
ncbi:hypothetical protein [Phycicoccus sonneratiae]|uniref:Uncharacterized protein n=1 Tax=Phycicoccus sonneratiae TaxID=2807628 RepID=A0ABS2CN43_9MICO|nr:hypothetical protein [Phycicoccus sonneraticus]MBM6401299.1 hypothetical protein [Phycicoccus sonneraticus]